MKLNKNLVAIFSAMIIVLALLISCKKDSNTDNGGNTPSDLSDLTTKVTASARGYVFDQTGEPVLNAQVTYGNKVTQTDAEGFFEIKNSTVVKNAAVLTVNASSNFFKAIKTAITSAGRTSFFKITLLAKNNIGTFNASSGGTVSQMGMQVQLPSNSVKNSSNNGTYSGNVNVSATYIDPTADNLTDIMPGDLRGVNAGGEVKGLTTFGMIGVELTGTGGESLQIADGKTATVTIPLPASLVATAPATIPLWHFNESTGLWEEQGTATKTGNSYVGQVSHFSYWNCDLPNAIVPLDFTVVDPQGNPINTAHVEITPITSGSWSHIGGYTDSTGLVSVYVTPNTQYQLSIYANCWNAGTPAYTQTFSVGTTAVSLGNVVVNNNQNMVTVSGRVIDCNNNAVSNGYVYVRNNYVVSRYPLNATGNYTFTTLFCSDSSTLQITGQDMATGNFSTTYVATIQSGSVTIPDIQACGVSTEKYVNYTIDGVSYSFTSPIDSVYSDCDLNTMTPIINIGAFGQSGYCYFTFTQSGIATGSTQQLQQFYASQINDSSMVMSSIPVNITNYGNTGEFYSGTFSGTLSGMGATHSIQVSFRDKRSW